ncbi:MAG: alanine dehydrogenase [Dehalococcoidia bacterium]|nr:alanine dehydrogenase [Dehalococcoidia bacterium]
MIVGCVTEIKTEEYRVGLTPESVTALVEGGHTVLIQAGAGEGSHYFDQDYAAAGAQVVTTAEEVWARAELLCKVKEPQESEFALMRPDQVLFTYLHLAVAPVVAKAMLDAGVIGVAYETVRRADGSLPLLAPMSEVAGRMAVEIGTHYLKRPGPGRGLLLGGVPGAPPGHVLVIGSGNVGANAVRIAVGLGARVTVASIAEEQLRALDREYQGRVETILSSPKAIADRIRTADLVIGAVLVEGERAPVVVTREMVRSMPAGSVIVDVAVDQGGCIETTRATDHSAPTYVDEGVIHYAVPNMPGAVPRTSSRVLAGLTLPYALRIANLGIAEAARRDPSLAGGVNLWRGKVTHSAVARALGYDFVPLSEAMGT